MSGVLGYNLGMEKIEILSRLHTKADIVWAELARQYPALRTVKTPDIVLNGRLWRTAGRAYQQDGFIELGWKFLEHSAKYRAIMYDVILPHELAHIADYIVYGESELECGHGKGWREMMVYLGLKPKATHNMTDIKR